MHYFLSLLTKLNKINSCDKTRDVVANKNKAILSGGAVVHRKRIIDQNRRRLQIRNCVLVIYKEQFELITHW